MKLSSRSHEWQSAGDQIPANTYATRVCDNVKELNAPTPITLWLEACGTWCGRTYTPSGCDRESHEKSSFPIPARIRPRPDPCASTTRRTMARPTPLPPPPVEPGTHTKRSKIRPCHSREFRVRCPPRRSVVVPFATVAVRSIRPWFSGRWRTALVSKLTSTCRACRVGRRSSERADLKSCPARVKAAAGASRQLRPRAVRGPPLQESHVPRRYEKTQHVGPYLRCVQQGVESDRGRLVSAGSRAPSRWRAESAVRSTALTGAFRSCAIV